MKLKLLQVREATTDQILSPALLFEMMSEEAKADRECFWAIHLNTKLMVIEKELVAMGSLDSAIAHPREIFRKAVLNSSSAIITVHNHPSGDTTPSKEDKEIWERLTKAGEILGIEVKDNFIIGSKGYYSEKEGK